MTAAPVQHTCRLFWAVPRGRRLFAQYNIQPYIDFFFNDKVDGRPHWQEICKYTLEAQGLKVGKPRRPLTELDAVSKRKVDKLLADMK